MAPLPVDEDDAPQKVRFGDQQGIFFLYLMLMVVSAAAFWAERRRKRRAGKEDGLKRF